MPRYFFHFRGEGGLDIDQDGLDLPDLDAAYLQAFESAREMWCEAIRCMQDPRRQQIEICDREGQMLLTVPFTDERMLAAIEEDIKLVHQHITRLEQLIDERRSKGRDTSLAEEILRTMRTCAVHHEKHRALLLREIAGASLAQSLYSASKEAIAHSRKLLGAVGGWPPKLAISRSPSSG